MKHLRYSRTQAARLLAAGTLLAAAVNASAAVRYVDVNNAHPSSPYTSWITAAAVIQDAVDGAVAGDEIVVTNGLYAIGGRTIDGITTNRVALDKPLALRSVNGPQFTMISGSGSVRCVYLADGASLTGFTLTNGVAVQGAGLWCQSTNAVVSNCVVSGNATPFRWYQPEEPHPAGGGTYGGMMNDCILTGNQAYGYFNGDQFGSGGGAFNATLNHCTLGDNFAAFGGGVSGCTLDHCTLSGNSARDGGGASGGTLNHCRLMGNSANFYGGGAYRATLDNSALITNSAAYGGGVSVCTVSNCTLTGNSVSRSGGGASGGTLNNCIVYFNTAPQGPNYAPGLGDPGPGPGTGDAGPEPTISLTTCCTTPQPTNGLSNFSFDPQLASTWHLSAASPCRGAGERDSQAGTDIDGEAWLSPPSIGCDEYHAGAGTGSLSVGIGISFTNVPLGFAVQFTALIEGRPVASAWEFGDGFAVTNHPYISHAWTVAGDYDVILRAYNESQPGGINATVTVHVVKGVHYVASGSPNPVPPYTSWSTAATNIQDAIDAAIEPSALVLVTNGIYAPIATFNLLAVRSVNGPGYTIIDGAKSNRCAYLTNGVSLSGFMLTNGEANRGGGVFCESVTAVVSNCVVSGNAAVQGGGAYGGTVRRCLLSDNIAYGGGGGATFGNLDNCTLIRNSAAEDGGGAYDCTLNNCTLTANRAGYSGTNVTSYGNGGGASRCFLNNCIVSFNTASEWANFDAYSTLHHCCTTTPPTNGIGNITNAPLFLDQSTGNLRLQSNSPCINAGLNALAATGPDLDGNPRIAGGTVDIGAYEFQSPASTISYAWLQQYGLPTDGSADATDPDRDGLNNWQEWRCGTDPANATSALRLMGIVGAGTNIAVTWQSVAGVSYSLERSPTATSTFTPLAIGLPGQRGTTTYTDTNSIAAGPWFYRVGVSTP